MMQPHIRTRLSRKWCGDCKHWSRAPLSRTLGKCGKVNTLKVKYEDDACDISEFQLRVGSVDAN